MLTKQYLLDLLANAELQKVLDTLSKAGELAGEADWRQEIVQQSARYYHIRREDAGGRLDREELRRELARITHALQSLITDLPETALAGVPMPAADSSSQVAANASKQPAPHARPNESSSKWISLALLVGIIGLLLINRCPSEPQFFAFQLALALAAGGLAGSIPGLLHLNMAPGLTAGGALGFAVLVFLVDPKSKIADDSCSNQPFAYTISLTAERGLGVSNAYPRLEQAFLKIRLDTHWDSARVDANGDAYFRGIAGNFKGQKVAVRLSARYWEVTADSVSLEKNAATLYIRPDNSLARLEGRVMEGKDGNPLPDVAVTVLGITTRSDANGHFAIDVPPGSQQRSYDVDLSHPRYKPSKLNTTPTPGSEFRALLFPR